MIRNWRHNPNMVNVGVIGVGGGGINAVNRMIYEGLCGVDYIALDTDQHSLSKSLAPTQLLVGAEVAHGRGTGGNLYLSQRAVQASCESMRAMLQPYDMVFITAALGGGLGSVLTPELARMAKELGILAVAIVTRPFLFEGPRRLQNADDSIALMETLADTLIVIPNDRLIDISQPSTTLTDAFHIVDDILHQGIQIITDLLYKPGLINLDFADIKTIISHPGATIMSSGSGSGENGAKEAAEQALTSSILGLSIHGAEALLVNITSGPDLNLSGASAAIQIMEQAAHPNANIIFGITTDAQMGDAIKISVIATGFKPMDICYWLKDHNAHQLDPILADAEKLRQPAEPEKPRLPRYSFRNYAVPAFWHG